MWLKQKYVLIFILSFKLLGNEPSIIDKIVHDLKINKNQIHIAPRKSIFGDIQIYQIFFKENFHKNGVLIAKLKTNELKYFYLNSKLEDYIKFINDLVELESVMINEIKLETYLKIYFSPSPGVPKFSMFDRWKM